MAIELDSYRLRRREELTLRLRDGTINRQEAEELKQILEYEKEQAINLNDILAIFAIAALLFAVASFLSNDKKKRKKRKLFGILI
jgi:uncharacterized membrane protein